MIACLQLKQELNQANFHWNPIFVLFCPAFYLPGYMSFLCLQWISTCMIADSNNDERRESIWPHHEDFYDGKCSVSPLRCKAIALRDSWTLQQITGCRSWTLSSVSATRLLHLTGVLLMAVTVKLVVIRVPPDRSPHTQVNNQKIIRHSFCSVDM